MTAGDWLPIDDAAKEMGRVLLWIEYDGGGYSDHGKWDIVPGSWPIRSGWLDDQENELSYDYRPTHYQEVVDPKLRKGE